jgi:PmbA protein
MLQAQKTLLYVDRFSGNQNPLTGDFSGVAKSSRLYKDGVDQGPVTETMIAGNMLHALHKLTGLSREVERVSGGLKSPSILLDGISVTAGG